LAEGHAGRLARGATAVRRAGRMQVADRAGGDVEGFFELRSRGSGRPRPPVRRPTWLGAAGGQLRGLGAPTFGVGANGRPGRGDPERDRLRQWVRLRPGHPSCRCHRRRVRAGPDAALAWAGEIAAPEVLRVGVCAECLDWLLILGRGHLERILRVYVRHYNQHRPQRALGLQPSDQPTGLTVDAEDHQGRVHRPDLLGGLLHEYRRAA
jgi:hypothetical protein